MKEQQRDELLILQKELDSMAAEVPEKPEDFHAGWVRAIEAEAMENQKVENTTRKKRFPWKRYLSIAAVAVFLIGGTAATRDWLAPRSESRNSNTGYIASETYGTYRASSPAGGAMKSAAVTNGSTVMMDYAVEEPMDAEWVEESLSMGSPDPVSVTGKKIIRSASMTLGTREYDRLYADLRARCESMGGWIENASESSSYNGLRTAWMTLRIPSNRLNEYTESLSTEGRIISRSESATDVTESYQDTEGRLATQKALMVRLQSLVTTAADLSDLLQLESQIADTQYTIDKLQSSLNSTDRQVSYATVDLTLREESDADDKENKELSFLERIGSAFRTGLDDFSWFIEDMVIFLTASLPYLVLIAIIITAFFLIRKNRKHRKNS